MKILNLVLLLLALTSLAQAVIICDYVSNREYNTHAYSAASGGTSIYIKCSGIPGGTASSSFSVQFKYNGSSGYEKEFNCPVQSMISSDIIHCITSGSGQTSEQDRLNPALRDSEWMDLNLLVSGQSATINSVYHCRINYKFSYDGYVKYVSPQGFINGVQSEVNIRGALRTSNSNDMDIRFVGSQQGEGQNNRYDYDSVDDSTNGYICHSNSSGNNDLLVEEVEENDDDTGVNYLETDPNFDNLEIPVPTTYNFWSEYNYKCTIYPKYIQSTYFRLNIRTQAINLQDFPNLRYDNEEFKIFPAVKYTRIKYGKPSLYIDRQKYILKSNHVRLQSTRLCISPSNCYKADHGRDYFTIDSLESNNLQDTTESTFLKGAGIIYQSWDRSGQSDLMAVRTKILAKQTGFDTPLKTKISPTWEEISIPTNQIVSFQGYIHAPVSGEYTFELAGDDRSLFLLNKNPGEPLVDTSDDTKHFKVYRAAHGSFRNPQYNRNYVNSNNADTKNFSVTLEGGKYYYAEMYGMNYGSSGHISLQATYPIPNKHGHSTNDNLQRYRQFQDTVFEYKIQTNAKLYYRKFKVTCVTGTNCDQQTFFFKVASVGQTELINFPPDNDSISTFRNEIREQFKTELGYNNLNIWVDTIRQDTNGKPYTQVHIRGDNGIEASLEGASTLEFGASSLEGVIVSTEEQYWDITGSYQLKIDGKYLQNNGSNDWPYDTHGNYIYKAIIQDLGFQYQFTTVQTYGNRVTGYTVQIFLRQSDGDTTTPNVFEITYNIENNGTPCTVDWNTLQQKDRNRIINYGMFDESYIASTQPTFYLKYQRQSDTGISIASVKAYPLDTLELKHIPIFFGNSKVVVNSATLNQATNTLTVSLDHQNPIDNTDIIEEMYIRHNGAKVQCVFSKPVANLNNILCQLEKYPSIGTYKLAVVFTKTQKVEYVDANINIQYKFVVLGLNQHQGPVNTANAVEVFFHPFDISYCSFTTLVEKITFVDGGNTADCQFHYQNLQDTTYNGQDARSITCTVDPVSNNLDVDTPYDVVVDTNTGDTDDTQDYTFVGGGDPAPELTDVSPKHWTPVQKGILNISGINLPTDDITKYLVKLVRRTTEPGDIQTDMSRYKESHDEYILPVTAVTPTNIEANLGGGVTGTFDIEVVYEITPLNKQSNFYFEYRIAIRDIQYPGPGSAFGGQTVIITGDNFSDVDVFDNNIFFYKRYTDAAGRVHDINEQCLVVDRGIDNSKEEIVCKAPALPDVVNNSPTGFDVIIQGRLIEESICRMPENCHLNNPPTCSCKYDYASISASPKVAFVQEDNAVTIASGDTGISIAATSIPLGSVQLLFQGVSAIYPATRVSATEITFDAPTDIDRGFYNVLVITSQGHAGVVPYNYVSTVSSVDGPTSQSTKGAILTLNGSGFRDTDFVKVGNTVCKIVSRTQQQIVFLSPAKSNGVSESIKLFQLNDNGSSTEVLTANSITYSNGKTPLATTCGSTTSICSTSTITVAANSSLTYSLLESSLSQFSNISNVSAYLRVSSDSSRTYTGAIVVSAGDWQITFTNVPVGIYNLELHDSDNGFAKITPKTQITINFPTSNTLTNFGPISLIGGKELTITTTVGFDSNIENSEVFVCGYKAKVTSASFNQLTFVSPNIYSNWIDETQTIGSDEIDMVEDKPYYTYQQEDIRGDLIGDYPNTSVKQRIQDGDPRTYYAHHGGDDCWVGYDYGEERRVRVSQIVFETSSIHSSQEYKLIGAEIQGSIDGTSWTTLFEIQEEAISGQNVYNAPYNYNPEKDRPFDKNYRYVRFYKSTNWCVIGEFRVNGFQSSTLEPLQTSANSDYINQEQVCNVQIEINGNQLYQSPVDPSNPAAPQSFLKTTYQLDSTPRIWSLKKFYGPIQGGTSITLTGKKLFKDDASKTKVFLDGVECIVSSVTEVQIKCTTGVKAHDSTHPREIRVEVDGVIAAVRDGVIFFYGLEWTNALTWGGDHFPVELDSIWVPKGQTLIIDYNDSAINLNTIVNEGTIVVADDTDINISAINIINRKSEFYVGTKLIQYTHTLVMKLSGSDYFARNQRHLPIYGNNVFVCHECTLVLNGKEKQQTWANVSTQIEAGATTIQYDHSEYPAVKNTWKVGDRIVIGTTSFDSNENEVRIISAVAEGVITVSEPIEFQHIKADQIGNDSTKLFVNTPVGNLSRNIIFTGADPSDTGPVQNQDYGAHMYIHGLNSSTRIANVEFQKTGQASIMERFSLTFETVRGLNDNRVVKCSFDRSYARGVNLRDSRYVLLYRNVFFGVRGHNIGLTSGTEMFNKITQNLIVAPRSAANLYQTDVTVAGIHLANPFNQVNKNHIVGSQFYGIQYELPTKPHGFHTSNLCPQGMKIGSLNNNEIHSNLGYGLFINNLRPRKYPCKPTRSSDFKNPWAANPQTKVTLSGQQIYKNKKVAILGYELGNLVFNNFVLFDNIRAGFQVHLTNDTEHGVIFKNGIIVCKSSINASPDELHTQANTAGIITPRTDGLTIESTYFKYFFAGTTVIAVASENYNEYVRIQGGKTVFIKSSFVTASTGAGLVRYIGPATNLVVDETGDFTQLGQPTYITRYYQHHAGVVSSGQCSRSNTNSPDKYDNSVLCSQTQLKPVMIGNLQKHNYFQQRWVKVFDLSDPSLDANNVNHYTSYRSVYIRNKRVDCRWCYPMILPVDRTFNVHWDRQLDWKHLMIYPVYRFGENSGKLALRFNHTINREIWNVYSRQEQDGSGSNIIHDSGVIGDIVNTASNSVPVAQEWGTYHHDLSNRQLYVSLNQQQSKFYQSIDIDGIYCKLTCATLGGRCGTTNTPLMGYHTDLMTNNWGFNRAHVAGRDAYTQTNFVAGNDLWIKCDQVLTLNNGEVLDASDILIDGKLMVNSGATIKTTNIWVRYGEMHVGSTGHAENVKIEFEKSSLNSELLVPTQAPGERAFVVSNLLTMNGKYPEISNVRLFSSVDAGETRICIYSEVNILMALDSKHRPWQASDRIGLGGSLVDGTGHEEVTISGNIAQGAETNEYCFDITVATQFYHYGSDKPSFTNAFASSVAFNDDDDDDDDDDDVLPLVTVQGHVHEDLRFDYRQSIDMRTTVQNLSRGIKIIDTTTENAGVHMLVHFEDTKGQGGAEVGLEYSGVLKADGVEFSFVGRPNTENAGLYFNSSKVPKDNIPSDNENVNASDYNQFVVNSSFSKCRGMCVNMYRSSRINFNYNSIFKGEQFLFKALHSKNLNVKNNYFVGVYKDQFISHREPETLIYMWSVREEADNVFVKSNVGQSSTSLGFNFPTNNCDENIQGANAFVNNEVGNVGHVGVIWNINKNACEAVGSVAIYHAKIGAILNTYRVGQIAYVAKHVLIAECQKGLILRSDSILTENDRFTHYIQFIQSFISSKLLDDHSLYADQPDSFKCTGQYGMQLLLTNRLGNSHPITYDPIKFESIETIPIVFANAYIKQVTFYNWRATYQGSSVCQNNVAFKTNENAAEVVPPHYLTDTRCINCEESNYFKFDDPKAEWLGLEGGCGTINCTGLKNALIQEVHTTEWFSDNKAYSVISNNDQVANHSFLSDKCVFIASWNAYKCDTDDLTVFSWESIGPDYNRLTPYPVNVQVKNDADVYEDFNTLNMWKEWDFAGDSPLNKRRSTFITLGLINKIHNIAYSGQQSYDMVFKMTNRYIPGDSNSEPTPRRVVVRQYYPSPLTVQVSILGATIEDRTIVPSYAISDPQDLTTVSAIEECGLNNYLFEEQVIEFVLNSNANCLVRVELVNHVQVNMRIGMTKEQFYSDTALQTNFINRIAALLGITWNRVKIVGIRDDTQIAGSRVLQESKLAKVEVRITSQKRIQTKAEGYTGQESYKELKELGDKLKEEIANDKNVLEIPVEDVEEIKVVVSKEAGADNNKDESTLFQESDIVIDPNTDGNNGDGGSGNGGAAGGDNQTLDKKKSSKSGSPINIMILAAIGLGVVIFVLVAVIAYHCYKKKSGFVKRTAPKKLTDTLSQRYLKGRGSVISVENIDEKENTTVAMSQFGRKSNKKFTMDQEATSKVQKKFRNSKRRTNTTIDSMIDMTDVNTPQNLASDRLKQ